MRQNWTCVDANGEQTSRRIRYDFIKFDFETRIYKCSRERHQLNEREKNGYLRITWSLLLFSRELLLFCGAVDSITHLTEFCASLFFACDSKVRKRRLQLNTFENSMAKIKWKWRGKKGEGTTKNDATANNNSKIIARSPHRITLKVNT